MVSRVTEGRQRPLIKPVARHNMMDGGTGPMRANDHTTSSFKRSEPWLEWHNGRVKCQRTLHQIICYIYVVFCR